MLVRKPPVGWVMFVGNDTRTEGDHYWQIKSAEGVIFATLPLGKHGAKRPEVEIGHVRQMARLFKIQKCAHRFFS